MASHSRQRSSRRPRDREPAFVAPVLDPTWQNPYSPSNEERESNRRVVAVDLWRRQAALLGAGAGCFVLGVVLAIVLSPVQLALSAAGIVAVLFARWRVVSVMGALESPVSQMTAGLKVGGTTTQMRRLGTIVDRLSATFGLSDVQARIVSDPLANATLLPDGDALALVVTTGLVEEFELIEVEGVIAHLMARARCSMLDRTVAASLAGGDIAAQRRLAGAGYCYRADEVAAAAIRYPLGSSPSGHVQMVASLGPFQAKAASKQTFLATERAIYGFFDVGVIDSSSTYHGALDTRAQKPGGIGRGGVYRVFVDSSLAVLGYTWSVAGNDYKKESAGFNQVFGRLNLATW